MARERAGKEGRERKEGSKQAGYSGGEPEAAGGATPPLRKVLEGTAAQGPTRCSLSLPSPTFPETQLKDRGEADDGGPGEEMVGPRRQPARRSARAGKGGSARGCSGPRCWQSSPRHAQTVKAGQGEVGGGSLGFYLRCNSLAED